jgi:predicted  nucleic acid-binding Zn-ribbon protein
VGSRGSRNAAELRRPDLCCKVQVRELEGRSEKLQGEVANAAAAREELARLRKEVRDAASRKGDLENLVRDLQKEELSLRVRSAELVPRTCERATYVYMYVMPISHDGYLIIMPITFGA